MIRVLAPDVVDKIAAGEVLERPANLIKELIENSIDAGADTIEVEFDGGGREVSVYDNGKGIPAAQLALALQRHATSKISQSEDLYKLHTFGFRGEALSSIAAVSRMTMTSRTRNSPEAYRVASEFGKICEPAAVSAREGTEVRVHELFANVPARLRFLKSEAAEHGQIKTSLKALALANPGVSFRARSRGELLFHWGKEQPWIDRASQILGVKKLYECKGESGGLSVHVLMSSPMETMNVNRNMWFFVQGRWIQDRSLSAAVMEAYRNLLMHGGYPAVCVRLDIPPEEVDVNVHPTKAQVKFRDPQSVFRIVCRTIREALEKAPWLATDLELAPQVPKSSSAPEFLPDVSTLRFSEPELERTQYSTKSFPLSQLRDYSNSYSAPAVAASVSATASDSSLFKWKDLHVVGQLNHTYILCQNAQAFYMVDQHAAHERVVFERLMEAFKNESIEVQNLLLPMVFDFSAEEVEALLKVKTSIDKMGLSIEQMGPESIAVQSIPSLVSESSVSEALQKLALELIENGDSFAFEKIVGDIFASMACHSVIRAGQSQSNEQMKALLAQMDDYPLSSFCPHGRPVYVKRGFAEIEREFGRIV